MNCEQGALADRHAPTDYGPVPHDDPPAKHIPTLLDDAIRAAGTNVTAVARKLAALNGTKMESKRRLLQKYLAGETVPDEPSARQLAEVLDTSEDHFVTERPRVSRRDLDAVWDEIEEIHRLLGELRAALGDQ